MSNESEKGKIQHIKDPEGRLIGVKIRDYKKPTEPGEVFPEFDVKTTKKGTRTASIKGAVLREEAHENAKRIHGGVRIFLIDKGTRSKIYLPKRAKTKDKDPNCLDYGGGEHSTVDRETGVLETWEQTAIRGLVEELGLRPGDYDLIRIPGHELDTSDPTQTEWGTFYIATVPKDHPLFPNKQEIDPSEGGWFEIGHLLEKVDDKVSEDNPLKDHEIRSMLLTDLRRPRVREAFEKFLAVEKAT